MTATETSRLTEWLLDLGGPIVRYRTAAELIDDRSGLDMKRLTADMMQSGPARLWLGRLSFAGIHSSKNTDFENVMGKLLEFGLTAGMRPLDARLAPYRQWLHRQADRRSSILGVLNASIVVGGLLRAGYEDQTLKSLVEQRTDELYELAAEGSYDIFADTRGWCGIHKALARKRFLKPELNDKVPFVHDIYALSAVPRRWLSGKQRQRIDAIVSYVLDARYQGFPDGYGCLRQDRDGKPHYYAMGWSMHLPLYGGKAMDFFQTGMLVQRLELMARFEVARKHSWFRACLDHLDQFRTNAGTYVFPPDYLREQRDGYWVTGAHMGLDEGRRTRQVLELESTFRMLKIKRLAGLA